MKGEGNLTNRDKKLQANKQKFWCLGCDAHKVGKLGKCPVCGYKNQKGKRIKQ